MHPIHEVCLVLDVFGAAVNLKVSYTLRLSSAHDPHITIQYVSAIAGKWNITATGGKNVTDLFMIPSTYKALQTEIVKVLTTQGVDLW